MKKLFCILVICEILILAASDSTVPPVVNFKSKNITNAVDLKDKITPPKDSSGSASAPKPKTICFEQRTNEGISYMHCEHAAASDSSSGASSSYSSYSSAPSSSSMGYRASYGGGQSAYAYRPQMNVRMTISIIELVN